MAQSKISVLIDVTVDKANQSLQSFRKSIADADGSLGKFKAGASGALDAVKANAGALAVAGGAALVAFGAKAVGAFTDTALEAGKLRDSLGLTAEQASGLMEVSGDLGIGLGALETSIGKMNLAVARTPGEFKKIGAAIVENDPNQTLLNAIDAINRIPDAAGRADAASRIFGKGWRDISELIGRGSADLKNQLEQVGSAKIITDEEVAKARKMRDAMENLKDVADDATVAFGEALVPALTSFAKAVVGTINVVKEFYDIAGKPLPLLNSPEKQKDFEAIKQGYLDKAGASEESAAADEAAATAAARVAERAGQQAAALDEATVAADDQAAANKRLTSTLEDIKNRTDDARMAQLAAIDSNLGYRNAQAAAGEAILAASIAVDDAKTSTNEKAVADRDAEGAILSSAAAAVKLAEDQAAANGVTLSAKDKTTIYKDELTKLAGYVGGDLAAVIQGYIDQLGRIPTDVSTTIAANNRVIGGQVVTGSGPDKAKVRASGGPVAAGEAYTVNENGTETLFMGNQPGYVMDANKTATALSGGGGNTYITVNAGTGDPRQIADALRRYIQNGGRIAGIN